MIRKIFVALAAASALSSIAVKSTGAIAKPFSPEAFIGPIDGRPQTAAMIAARCSRVIKQADAMRVALEKSKAPVSLATLKAYDDIVIVLNGANGGLYQEVMLTDAARKAGGKCSDDASAASTKLSLSRPIYDKLKQLLKLDLDPATRWTVERELLGFEISGVQLDAAGRAKVQQLNEEISKAGTAFDQVIADDKSTIVATVAELDGLPADYIAAHKPGADGKVTLTMNYPDYVPAITYAKNREFRRRYYEAFNRRGFPANEGNLRTLIDKRQALATALGKPNYATVALQDRMLTTPRQVQNFLDELVASARPAAQRDIARKLKALGMSSPLNVWDNFYATEIVQKTQYGYDSLEARRYFAFDKVEAGILKLSEDLFGVRIRRWNTPVWSKGVEAYEMLDHGKVIGRFYFDLHPQPGKYTHANAVPIRPGITGRMIPTGALVTNVPGGDGTPGLMTHDDVTTLLHEYGHLLHYLFAGQDQKYSLRSGVATEWDFVEAPSQMLENWLYDYDTLAAFATDENGKPIPRELVRAMERSRYFDSGLFDQRQSAVANASLGFYLGTAPPALGPRYRELVRRYDPLPVPETNEGQDNLGHLNGYGPAYYTYLWSKVIADDLFSRFEREGLRNPKTAADYRRLVLQPGGTMPAAQLIQDFLGRPLSLESHKKVLENDR